MGDESVPSPQFEMDIPIPRVAQTVRTCQDYLVCHLAGGAVYIVRRLRREDIQDLGLYIWPWRDLEDAPIKFDTVKAVEGTFDDGTPEVVVKGRRVLECYCTKGVVCKVVIKGWDGRGHRVVFETPAGWQAWALRTDRKGKWAAVAFREHPRVTRRSFDLLENRVGLVDCTRGAFKWLFSVRAEDPDGAGLSIGDVAVSDDGRFAALACTGGAGGLLALADTSEGKILWRVSPDGALGFNQIDFTPDGKVVYGGGGGGMLYGFDVATGRTVSQWLIGDGKEIQYPNRIYAVAVSPDGKLVAAGDAPNGRAYLWSRASGERVNVFTTGDMTILGLAFSPDSKRLATVGAMGKRIRIWRMDHK